MDGVINKTPSVNIHQQGWPIWVAFLIKLPMTVCTRLGAPYKPPTQWRLIYHVNIYQLNYVAIFQSPLLKSTSGYCKSVPGGWGHSLQARLTLQTLRRVTAMLHQTGAAWGTVCVSGIGPGSHTESPGEVVKAGRKPQTVSVCRRVFMCV